MDLGQRPEAAGGGRAQPSRRHLDGLTGRGGAWARHSTWATFHSAASAP